MRRPLIGWMIAAAWAFRVPAQERNAPYPKTEGFAGYSAVLTNSVSILHLEVSRRRLRGLMDALEGKS